MKKNNTSKKIVRTGFIFSGMYLLVSEFFNLWFKKDRKGGR